MLFAIGGALLVISLVLVLDLGGAGAAVIHRVTSQPLGELAPGFAASRFGFRIYSGLVGTLGVIVVGIAIAQDSPITGAIVIVAGLVAFAVLSVVAIRGEVTTYRGLKR